MYYVVGLGNPGKEYEKSRHNAGRAVAVEFAKAAGKKGKVSEPKSDKKLRATVISGEFSPGGGRSAGKKKFRVILPETFMNKSGASLKPVITSKKKAENLIVVHDDIDLPLGSFKVSFGRGSGGHKGVESIIRSVGTKNFVRIRIGVSPATPKGKLRKPKGEKMLDFIIGDFKPEEARAFKKAAKRAVSAIESIMEFGREKAMSLGF